MAQRKDLKKKIASLSALGTGILVLGAGNAEAGVVYSGPLNVDVGFGPSGIPFFQSNPMGASNADFLFFATASGSNARGRYGIFALGCGCFGLRPRATTSSYLTRGAVDLGCKLVQFGPGGRSLLDPRQQR